MLGTWSVLSTISMGSSEPEPSVDNGWAIRACVPSGFPEKAWHRNREEKDRLIRDVEEWLEAQEK